MRLMAFRSNRNGTEAKRWEEVPQDVLPICASFSPRTQETEPVTNVTEVAASAFSAGKKFRNV